MLLGVLTLPEKCSQANETMFLFAPLRDENDSMEMPAALLILRQITM